MDDALKGKLRRLIYGAIKNMMNAHPEWPHYITASLQKRVFGAILQVIERIISGHKRSK